MNVEKIDEPGDETTAQLQSGMKPLIRIRNDKSTFYTNAAQYRYWGDGTMKQNHLDRLLWYLRMDQRNILVGGLLL